MVLYREGRCFCSLGGLGNIYSFHCHNQGRCCRHVERKVPERWLVSALQCPGQPPQMRNCPTQRVDRAEAEKDCFRLKELCSPGYSQGRFKEKHCFWTKIQTSNKYFKSIKWSKRKVRENIFYNIDNFKK